MTSVKLCGELNEIRESHLIALPRFVPACGFDRYIHAASTGAYFRCARIRLARDTHPTVMAGLDPTIQAL